MRDWDSLGQSVTKSRMLHVFLFILTFFFSYTFLMCNVLLGQHIFFFICNVINLMGNFLFIIFFLLLLFFLLKINALIKAYKIRLMMTSGL